MRGILCYICGLNISGLLMILVGQPAWAGAWPVEGAHGQVISTSLFDTASKAYDASGKASRTVNFRKVEESLFIEHALDKDWTLVVSTAFQDVSFTAGASEVSFSGLGESYIGLRKTLWRGGNSIVSIQPGLLVSGSGETISDADLGLGKFGFEPRVLAGHSFKLAGRDSFGELQAARRFRKAPYPNDWRLDATMGVQVTRKLQVLGQAFYTSTQASPEIARANSRLKLQASLVLKRSQKTSWQFGVYETIAGKNSVRERAFLFAIWSRY